MIKTFILSTELFWGWRSILDTSIYDNENKIITQILYELKEFLKSRNLQELVKKVDEMTLHFHNDLYDVIHNESNVLYYICDHCHN